ncbi:hypothetical protein R1flu_003053 [Riccia fluitans]|uniref:Uncharacterized protein n=1 Tax=Riccia fluitans TaxID=41844 RepID=A0ABD1Y836_9MARC
MVHWPIPAITKLCCPRSLLRVSTLASHLLSFVPLLRSRATWLSTLVYTSDIRGLSSSALHSRSFDLLVVFSSV